MIMDNNNTNNNNNKPNNKVNMPKFNLNWLYMIIALMLLGLWWSSDSRGSGSKVVPYSDFQKYVTNGYISKVLGSEKTLEAHVKPNAVGAIFGADSTKVGRNPIITSNPPSKDRLDKFLQDEKAAGHFDGIADYPADSDIFPAILINILPLVLLIALWIFFMRRMKIQSPAFRKGRLHQDYIQGCSRPGGSKTGSRRNRRVSERTSEVY